MKRRDFVRILGGAVAAGAAFSAVVACGGDDGGGDAADAGVPNCTANGARAGTISVNHGHLLTVSAGDINAGTAQTYSIQGSSIHVHSITLSAADMTTLQGGGSVTVTSTSGAAHTHSVTVVCA